MARRVDGSHCEEIGRGGDVVDHDTDEFDWEVLHDGGGWVVRGTETMGALIGWVFTRRQ